MFPDVFPKDVVGAEETFARCMEGGGLGASTSLNWGCAASPTSCRMRASLVERKAPLCRIRASATRRSTWLQGERGCQPRGPTPGPLAKWALPGSPIHTPGATPFEGPPHLREEQASTTTWTCSPRSRRSRVVFWGQREVRANPRQEQGSRVGDRDTEMLRWEEGAQSRAEAPPLPPGLQWDARAAWAPLRNPE